MPADAEIADATLEAYLAEQLPAAGMSAIEEALRRSDPLRQRLADVISRRDVGQHSVGDVWRSARLSCPSREELGNYLLGVCAVETEDYIRFHTERIGCRYCNANLDDLRRSARSDAGTAERRRRYFETSVGRLGKQND